MTKSNEDLVAMRSELENDPTAIGLTTNPAHDAANADRINEIRDTIAIERDDVPADDVRSKITRDDWAAITPEDRSWLDFELVGGQVDTTPGTPIRAGLTDIFQGKPSLGNLQTLLTRDGRRWEEMVQDGLLKGQGDWTPSDIAAARVAT